MTGSTIRLSLRRRTRAGRTSSSSRGRARTSALTVILRDEAAVAESDEDKPGVILDYDEEGNLISLEILDAAKRVYETKRFEFETV